MTAGRTGIRGYGRQAMKRAVTLSMTLAFALPLLAEETKKPETKKSETAAQQPLPSVQQAPATGDSPLVQAAKRANRLGRKPATAVITNESLARSKGGHVTTTSAQAPIKLPPPDQPTAAEKAAAARKEAEARRQAYAAEQARKKAEEEKRRQERMAAAHEEGFEEGQQDDADGFAGQAPPPPPR